MSIDDYGGSVISIKGARWAGAGFDSPGSNLRKEHF